MKCFIFLSMAILFRLAYGEVTIPYCETSGGTCIDKAPSTECDTLPKLCPTDQVCCKDLPQETNSTRGINIRNLNCVCGISNKNRIIGGQVVAPRHKYPWMAKLDIGNGGLCGGSLINDRYVLTAAHCIYDEKTKNVVNAKDVKVTLAEHNQYSTIDDICGVTRTVDVLSITPHNRYNPQTSNNDIALLKLKKPLNLLIHQQIRSVCLPTNPYNTYAGVDGIVAGWGVQIPSVSQPSSKLLREVTVPILNPTCTGYLPNGKEVTKNMLCTGTVKGGKADCYGDSGGPLIVKDEWGFILAGIVSFSYEECALPSSAGIFTRVTRYLDWISANTADANYCYNFN